LETYIGRQPIFDELEQVYAYELLYRNNSENYYDMPDADMATYDVIAKTFVSFGVHEISQGRPCFINFTENLLMSPIFEQLSAQYVVIELLENIDITDEVIYRVKQLKKEGYRIALDDFLLVDELKESAIFKYVDIIKVDFMIANEEERLKIEYLVRKYYPHITLLAEKVETYEEYKWARLHGYKLFQGYFFKRPQVIVTQDIPANILQYYRVIALLREADPNINELASTIERDMSLSYKLLKLINSSPKRPRYKVRSIKEAIISIGLKDLQQWLYILTYREMQDTQISGRMQEVMKTSLVRAKLCESLARYNGEEQHSEYFLVGMFSLIDVLLARPLEDILQQLPLSEEVVSTIAGADTPLQPYLQLVISLENMEIEHIRQFARQIEVPATALLRMHYEATKWANQVH
jgi:c-di-GMP phosphodiesterase